MSVSGIGQGVYSGAGFLWTAEGTRIATNQRIQEMSPPTPSTADQTTQARESALQTAQSPWVQWGLTAASAGLATAQGAVAGVTVSGTAITGFGGAALGLGQFIVIAGASMAAFKVTEFLSEHAVHGIASVFGIKPVTTTGDKPVCVGDDVYHQNKSAAFWGALGGVIAGALVGALIIGATIATGGLAAVTFGVMLGAGVAGGAVGGIVSGIGKALSQYGEKKGKIKEGSLDVFFEGKNVARVGDLIECDDHAGPHYVAEGAKTVFANGFPIARIGHQTTCDGNVDGGCKTIVETEETSEEYRLPIESSVPLWLREAATYVPLAMSLFGLARGLKGLAGARANNRNTCSDPVDVATGDFAQQWPVLYLDGVLPLELTRSYFSTLNGEGGFGQKWSDDWSQHLIVDNDEIIYWDAEGGAYNYPASRNQVYAQNERVKEFILFGQKDGELYLFNRRRQQTLTFSSLDKKEVVDKRYLTAISDRFGNRIDFIYDPNGLQRVNHSDGYFLRVESDKGRIIGIEYFSEQNSQRLVSCEFNQHEQLILCDSFQFGKIAHSYTIEGYMTEWRDTDKTHATVTYDEKGRVITVLIREGHYSDRFEYHDEVRHTVYYDAEGGVTHYWYNEDNLVTKIEDPLGRVTETEWQYGEKISETDSLGRKTLYQYSDEYGELLETILPNGESCRFTYTSLGQLTSTQFNNGECWNYRYGAHGELESVTNALGEEWAYRYDAQGRIVRTTLPDGNYYSYEYNEQTKRLETYRNIKGQRTQLTQDLFGRITRVVLPDNSQYRYEYSEGHANPDGSLTKLTTPEGATQHFSYNSERLLTEVVDGNSNKTKYTYGACDLLNSQTLPNGERLIFHYDKLTRLTEVRNSQGDSYRYEYDKAGQLIKETDFTGRARCYAYDIAGRLIRRIQADGGVETYVYDENDRLLSYQTWQPKYQKGEVKAGGKTPEKLTALLEDINLEGYELAHQVSYSYTKKTGQLEKTINTQYLPYFAEHITEFEYNEQHRLIAEIQDGERVEVTLDQYGRQTTLLLPNGKSTNSADSQSTVRISQGFNQYGELIQFQVNDHNPLMLGYDKLGRRTRIQNQNGFILAEHFSPSGLLQAQGGGWHNELTEEQLNNYQPNHTYPIAGTQISRKWQYDKAFNLTHTQDNHWGATEYRVNKNGQVTDVLNGIRSSEHYRYDSQLNLTQKVQRETNENGQYQLQAANDASFGIKQRHGRITRYGNKTYKYDELGRLQSKTETKKGFRPVTTYYKWNSQSQLVELHSPHKGTWRYEYDAFGRRITKYQVQTDQAGITTPSHQYKNQLIDMPIRPNQDYWHKINELWEAEAKNEQIQNEVTENENEKTPAKTTALSANVTSVSQLIQGYRYLYKQDQLVAEAPLQIAAIEGNLALQAEGQHQLLQANWNDAIYWLYQEDDFTPTARYEKGQLHYTVADQVGTITELLTEDGYIDYRQKLNLWGEAEIDGHRHYAANDSDALKCNHRFVGQYYDEESELHYNRFRYYSPETGQYLSHDPIGLLGGFNPYGYVDIPTVVTDYYGLSPSSDLDKALGGRVGDRLAAHHVIPVEVWGENKSFLNKIGMGGMRDTVGNGIHLPGSKAAVKDDVGHGIKIHHSSNHPAYSQDVRDRLGIIRANYESGNISAKEARLQVKRLQMQLKRELASARPNNDPVRRNSNGDRIINCKGRLS